MPRYSAVQLADLAQGAPDPRAGEYFHVLALTVQLEQDRMAEAGVETSVSWDTDTASVAYDPPLALTSEQFDALRRSLERDRDEALAELEPDSDAARAVTGTIDRKVRSLEKFVGSDD